MTWINLEDIKLERLKQIPVWEFRFKDYTELVKPCNKKALTENDTVTSIVLTKFVLSNGKTEYGYCSPQDTSGLDSTQPVIIIEGTHIPLFLTKDKKKKKAFYFQVLGEDIFPIQVESMIPCDGVTYTETVNEFVIED